MDKYIGILKKKEIKCTKARISILKLMVDREEPISADDIHMYFYKQGINIDLSTVYRTLEMFNNKGIVEKFDIGKGKYNYIFKGHSHKHVLTCKLCHKEVEIDCPMPQIREMVKDKTGFLLLEEDIKFKGICRQCMDKAKNKDKEDLK